MAQNVLSITQLTEYIRGRLDDDPFLGQVAVRGEISNYKVYPSGHHYFTLKDEGAALKCVMFKSSAVRLRFRPDNGMKVIAMGKVTVYPRDGAYQLYCAAMAMDGVGDLYAAFEQLKKKLAAQGLFDPAHKKPLPKCPGTIGIVTSSAGAAVHDMLRILRKRYPLTKVRLLPVRVQGAEAPGEIAAAIRYANRYRLADLLIVGRGGGSIEDLWAFNDELVAHAIYESEIPVISAVGHEPDVTISDYVADLRAATPSNAAELAVPDQDALRQNLDAMSSAMEPPIEGGAAASERTVPVPRTAKPHGVHRAAGEKSGAAEKPPDCGAEPEHHPEKSTLHCRRFQAGRHESPESAHPGLLHGADGSGGCAPLRPTGGAGRARQRPADRRKTVRNRNG